MSRLALDSEARSGEKSSSPLRALRDSAAILHGVGERATVHNTELARRWLQRLCVAGPATLPSIEHPHCWLLTISQRAGWSCQSNRRQKAPRLFLQSLLSKPKRPAMRVSRTAFLSIYRVREHNPVDSPGTRTEAGVGDKTAAVHQS